MTWHARCCPSSTGCPTRLLPFARSPGSPLTRAAEPVIWSGGDLYAGDVLPEELGEREQRAARTYSAAAGYYGLASLGFWNRFGAATVSRLPLEPGHAVLDLCCGAGAAAISAARAVGPAGYVVG